MRGVQAACPSCGGPVQFKISSALVTVCGFCRTVVARTDKKIEDLGKVAALVETESPLRIDLKGTWNGKSFLIVGRVQYRHAAGGMWDEWYAAFPNNRWGWLAEAMGRFYITFEKDLPESVPLPTKEELEPGQRVRIADQELTIAEIGRAQAAGAEGEMPFVLHPGESHDYADLYGSEKRFVTLDYGTARPTVFVGKEVTLDQLGISPDDRGPEKAPRQVGALRLNCPQCGSPLELRAPDQTQRVVCPSCHALLDAAKGNLQYLETLEIGRAHFSLEIGAAGTLDGVEYTLIGAMQRSVTFEGTDYYWSEYLLYQPRVGFRWLVESEHHWSFVEAVSPGDVVEGNRSANYQGETFRLFQQATATVRYVLGEFYWKVTLGEDVYTRDFIAPPRMLSIEHSVALTPAASRRRKKRGQGPPNVPPPLPLGDDNANEDVESDAGQSDALNENEPDAAATAAEINYSLGTYLTHEAVEEAFHVGPLPRGWSVAPNQPQPVDNRVFVWWAGFLGAIGAFYMLGDSVGPGADGWLALWAVFFVSLIPVGALMYRQSFEVSRWKESEYSPYQSNDE